MTIVSSNRSLFALFLAFLFALIPSLPSGADGTGFARSLFTEGDYFRAIGEFKRIRYESADSETDWACTVRIVESYRLSRKYESALSELFRIGDPEKLTPERREWTLSNIALSYQGLRLIPNAHAYLDAAFTESGRTPSARAFMYRGLLYAETADWDRASADFSRTLGSTEPAVSAAARIAAEIAAAAPTLPRKSPGLAAVLSFFVPGLGQAYSGHWFDALQAFGTVALFGLASGGTFLYERDNGGTFLYSGLLAGATLTLHASNVFGAYKTAEFRNRRTAEDALAPIRDAVLSLSVSGDDIFPPRD